MSRFDQIRLRYPGGKRFAFTVFDDCDNATVKKIHPFYELLGSLGMRTTKGVFSLASAEVHPNWRGSSTLEDPQYREFVKELAGQGFEIGWHGASMMSKPREQIERGLELFHETFGHYPRCYANHGSNRENVYWFNVRFRSRLLRVLYSLLQGNNSLVSEGHVPGSPYFWGDLCRQHIEYVRGFAFPKTNLRSVHPDVLYCDPATEYVNFWFLAADAPSAQTFNELLNPARQDRLEREGGVCIIATHVANGFVKNGEVNRETRGLLEALAQRQGWFAPVSNVLDHLRSHGLGRTISGMERWRVEVRWLYAKLRLKNIPRS